jgi:hypothetical protein
LHNQRQNQNNERRGNEQKTAADNAGRNNRRSVIIVEVMADGANFGLFVQWRSKQKNSFTGASARKALPRIPLRRLGAGPEKHVPEKRGPAFR